MLELNTATVAQEDLGKNNWCSIQSCVACAWILISPIRHFQSLIMGMDSVLSGALSGPWVLAFSLQHPAVAAETPPPSIFCVRLVLVGSVMAQLSKLYFLRFKL